MKSTTIAVAYFLVTLHPFAAFGSNSPQGERVRVSVAQFTDRTSRGGSFGSGCHAYYAWAEQLGSAFSDLLVEELEKNPRLEVLERGAISRVYENEIELVNSEADRSLKRGRFKKAKITFIGTVDAFEYCQSGSRAAVNVGSFFGIGNVTPSIKSSSAMVSVLIRAVDTSTGKVLATARGKSEQSKRGIGIDVSNDQIDFSGADFRQSPLGEAIKKAIQEAGGGVVVKLKLH